MCCSCPSSFYRKMQPGTVISAMTAELNAIGFFLGGAIAIPITSVFDFYCFSGLYGEPEPLAGTPQYGGLPL